MYQLLEDTTRIPVEDDSRPKRDQTTHKDDVSSFEMQNEVFNWALRNNKNAETFRRSMLPFYLLKEDKDWKYPRYIEFSNLALNLCDKTSIKVNVILESKLW